MSLKREIKKLADVVNTRLPLRQKEPVYKEISDRLSKLVERKPFMKRRSR